jgi:hypothetical protein
LHHIRDSKIGDEKDRGISGGQRKRVSIAMEMVSYPSLLFLDEPTSGLDSSTSHSVVEMVERFAKESNCTSIAVIHQPRFDTLQLFNQIVLLATGGYLVYSGPATKVVTYFKEELGVDFPPMANPADVFMDAITLESARHMLGRNQMRNLSQDDVTDTKSLGEALAQRWHQASPRYASSEDAACAPLPELDVIRCGWGKALIIQMRRAMIQTVRAASQQLMLGLVLVLGILAIVYGLPTDNDLGNILVQPGFALFFLMLTQGVAAQRIFGGAERCVGWRESSVGVNMVFYFAGRDLAALVDILLGSMVFCLVYWAMGPLQVSSLTMLESSFAFIYATWGLSYIWSVALEPAAAQMVSVVVSFICFLLSGLQPAFASINTGFGIYLMCLSPIRWAHGFLIFNSMRKGSEYSSPMIQYLSSSKLDELGMPLKWIAHNPVFPDGWNCESAIREHYLPIGLRWMGCTGIDPPKSFCTPGGENYVPGLETMPPNSFVCSTSQLYLLGMFFRVVALVLFNFNAKSHANGGGTSVEVPGGGKSSRTALAKFMRNLFCSFLLALTIFEGTLLIHMY